MGRCWVSLCTACLHVCEISCLCVCASFVCLCISACLSLSLCIYLCVSASLSLSGCLCISVSQSVFFHLSVFLSVSQSLFLCFHLCLCTIRIITSPSCLWLLREENLCQGWGSNEGDRPSLIWHGSFPGRLWRLSAGGKRHSAQEGLGLVGRPFLGQDCLLCVPCSWLAFSL